MRVTVYDKLPGTRAMDKFLAVCWAVGCFLQKLFGQVDEYYGATSWADAMLWLSKRPAPLSSIQYWGHGSSGCVWLAQKNITPLEFTPLKPKVTRDTVVWFRTCSTFAGPRGQKFAAELAATLGCVVAGHTRTIGLLQSGLHTHRPATQPTWSAEEGDKGPAFLVGLGLQWGNNTVTCLATKIPEGW